MEIKIYALGYSRLPKTHITLIVSDKKYMLKRISQIIFSLNQHYLLTK